MVACDVNLLSPRLPFSRRSLSGHLYFALGAGGINLHLGIRRAFAAKPFVTVPAPVAGVTHAAATAMKMALGLFDGRGKRLVVRLAVTRLRQALGDVAGLVDQVATKHPGGAAKPARGLPAAKRHKIPAPGITATLAVKFKLEAGIGAGLDRMIGKIFAEMNFAHDNIF
jgi:hypothetical protein